MPTVTTCRILEVKNQYEYKILRINFPTKFSKDPRFPFTPNEDVVLRIDSKNHRIIIEKQPNGN